MSLDEELDKAGKGMPKHSFGKPSPLFHVFIGFMRMITLNFKLFGKPACLGWRKT
jgi:hypothetical protein